MPPLAPVHDPLHNLRQCVKQCVLLEDHLFVPEHRCTDCILKHMLMVEALLEEAFSLDTSGEHAAAIRPLLSAVAGIRDQWVRARDAQKYDRAGQQIRAFRKPLQSYAYTGNR